jgi:hypothetical protein
VLHPSGRAALRASAVAAICRMHRQLLGPVLRRWEGGERVVFDVECTPPSWRVWAQAVLLRWGVSALGVRRHPQPLPSMCMRPHGLARVGQAVGVLWELGEGKVIRSRPGFVREGAGATHGRRRVDNRALTCMVLLCQTARPSTPTLPFLQRKSTWRRGWNLGGWTRDSGHLVSAPEDAAAARKRFAWFSASPN